MEEAPGEITRVLGQWKQGAPDAFDQLMAMTYPQLRRIAAGFTNRERPGAAQATELVHELYIRLLGQRTVEWKERNHFFTFAAQMMRRILIDSARRAYAEKRGGGMERVPLSDELPWIIADSPDMLALDLALEELAAIDPAKVRIVELRYFLGCTANETADILEVSKPTVDRELKLIRAWLFQKIRGAAPDS